MRYTLVFDGVPVGFVALAGAPRAVGSLFTLPAFEGSGLRHGARRLGIALRLLAWARVSRQVSARALASALAHVATLGIRLGLVDERGSTAAIWRITVVEFPDHRVPVVVAALRDQAVPRGAVTAPIEAGPGSGARPAA